MDNTQQLRVLGVSAGNGVMLFPFRDQVIGNVELRSDYTIRGNATQWFLNFPNTFFTKDLPTMDSPDIIIGHPKCGNSSKLALSRGKKLKSHVGEPSLALYFKSIELYEPKAFLMENLPALLDSYSLEDLQFMFPNYALFAFTGSMFNFGNSQKNRVRLVLVGVRRDQGALMNAFFMEKIGGITPVREPQLTKDLLMDISTLQSGHFRPSLDERIALYGGCQRTYREIKQIWEQQPHIGRLKTPSETFKTAPGVYRDLPTRYPNTIRKSNRCFSPLGLTYTPRQRARIQGIPDSFKILSEGSETKTLFNKGCITTGSTPCYEIGEWFKARIKGCPIT